MEIPQNILSLIYQQAETEYPHECCGVVMGPQAKEGEWAKVIRCHNVQDKYHELDPENFPRTSKTAYFMDPAELLKIHKQMRESGQAIRMIYHSHVDSDAVFSEEDKRQALADNGFPVYPGVLYCVVSVFQGRVRSHQLFRWESKKEDFILCSKIF